MLEAPSSMSAVGAAEGRGRGDGLLPTRNVRPPSGREGNYRIILLRSECELCNF